jgi:uncharacterized delta-60 repeat protein
VAVEPRATLAMDRWTPVVHRKLYRFRHEDGAPVSDFDLLVSAALDAQVPFRLDRRPDWADVLARADLARVTGPQQTTTSRLPRRRRRVMLAFALVAVGVVVAGSALATRGYDPLGGLRATAGHRPGSLDTSFGRGGFVTTPIGDGAGASALAIQQDGKLVAAGTSNIGSDTDRHFALVRYHANGKLDGSFGTGGKATTTIGPGGGVSFGGPHPGGAFANALAIQKDGKLVAAGACAAWPPPGCGDFALARYNANGTLDTSFGRGGIVTTPIGDGVSALAIQKDGKLVAAGRSAGPTGLGRFALVRYNANGRLDTSFGRGGKATTQIAGTKRPGYGAGASALAIQQDGKLVAAGWSGNGYVGAFWLVRYNANGTLDTSFGRGGKATTPTGTCPDCVSALAIQQDGKLVAAGTSYHNQRGNLDRFALVRYNANGTLDGSFGRGGKVTTPTGGASALAIQQDGKLVAAGSRNNRFALVRYNPNGTLDGSFGRGGKVTTPITIGSGAGASALAIQQDGKLVAAGWSGNGSASRFALVRYWP